MKIQYQKIQDINLHKIAAQRNGKNVFDGRSFLKKTDGSADQYKYGISKKKQLF
ncbi:hypothetical protein [Sphingobacterium sp. UME9]|uniref:hypothetical protein n=1 Tax=Sphingobacterium sp. UME9 TaxID=1862316 RepID=UPI0015FF485A|nr:hypothetical protein [Sphingobacterium sp. UME9]